MSKHQRKALIMLLEMGTGELLMRMIAAEVSTNVAPMRNRKLCYYDLKKYVKYIDLDNFKNLQNHIIIPNIKRLNIAKIEEAININDALNGIVYPDDKQIVSLTVNKFYANNEFVSVKISAYSCGSVNDI